MDLQMDQKRSVWLLKFAVKAFCQVLLVFLYSFDIDVQIRSYRSCSAGTPALMTSSVDLVDL